MEDTPTQPEEASLPLPENVELEGGASVDAIATSEVQPGNGAAAVSPHQTALEGQVRCGTVKVTCRCSLDRCRYLYTATKATATVTIVVGDVHGSLSRALCIRICEADRQVQAAARPIPPAPGGESEAAGRQKPGMWSTCLLFSDAPV